MASLPGDLLHDDERWAEYVGRAGLGVALGALNDTKSELRRQRRERAALAQQGTKRDRREWQVWLSSQARFQAVVDRRLTDVRAALAAQNTGPDGSPNGLRKGMTELVDLVADLALEIDGSEVEYLLDEYHIVLGNVRMTLAEAIDSGRFDRRKKKEAQSA